jgi:hypothetical protein
MPRRIARCASYQERHPRALPHLSLLLVHLGPVQAQDPLKQNHIFSHQDARGSETSSEANWRCCSPCTVGAKGQCCAPSFVLPFHGGSQQKCSFLNSLKPRAERRGCCWR